MVGAWGAGAGAGITLVGAWGAGAGAGSGAGITLVGAWGAGMTLVGGTGGGGTLPGTCGVWAEAETLNPSAKNEAAAKPNAPRTFIVAFSI